MAADHRVSHAIDGYAEGFEAQDLHTYIAAQRPPLGADRDRVAPGRTQTGLAARLPVHQDHGLAPCTLCRSLREKIRRRSTRSPPVAVSSFCTPILPEPNRISAKRRTCGAGSPDCWLRRNRTANDSICVIAVGASS